MRLFIDSADVSQIHRCCNTGLIDGVTTNPSLIRKTGRNSIDVYQELSNLGIDDISMEVYGTLSEMIDQGNRLNELFSNVITVKVPMTEDGLQACRYFSEENIRTNVTLVFNAAQALLAAKAGATYVSPFVGRIDDQGYAGLEVVRSIASLYCQTGVPTQVLAASIRTPHRAVRSYFNGAQVVTMPPDVFWKMYDHVLTDAGLETFDKDVEEISKAW